MGLAHGQAPPEAAQGVRKPQSSQVLSSTRTSSDLVGSTADKTTEWADWKGPAHGQAPLKATKGGRMTLIKSMAKFPERYPNTERLTEAEMKVPWNQSLPCPIVKTEAREHLHRTESKSTKRARKAKAKAKRTADAQQGAIPCRTGEVPDLGGSMADKPKLSTGMADETEDRIRAEGSGSLTDEGNTKGPNITDKGENKTPSRPHRTEAERSAAVAAQRAKWEGGGAWSGWSSDPEAEVRKQFRRTPIHETEGVEQFRRTEAEMTRKATAAAQGTAGGAVGGWRRRTSRPMGTGRLPRNSRGNTQIVWQKGRQR
jgi:hypothetical protein